MFLQHFVENSIRHGFRSLEVGGIIRIKGYRESNNGVFIIEDNGCGITLEKLSLIFTENRGHIGCNNVKKRIELKHGASASISIDSIPNIQKTVKIIIPYLN